ncbi:hypothetical protein SAMN05421767_11624 [Granulicatella balaenopterae]|uniref:SMODS and SLOG-associating 2TM effector domain-containing protein n=1 Tax=Granulicatella balaenopterae TaxID=137733 RepID=A0A1H9KYX5_9LACT|nr:SLATT domain-containing protein [Granulicatella balaenopterae]SER04392.1 hypothetical protein SAMN05421767_11624 [Granulicatella balaenopterae]
MENYNEAYILLEENITKLYQEVTVKQKEQELSANIVSNRCKWLEYINIMIIALTSVGVFMTIFNDIFVLKIISSALAIAALVFTVFLKIFDLKSRTYRHKNTANDLLELKNAFHLVMMEINLQMILQGSIEDLATLKDEYDALASHLSVVYMNAPAPCKKAVKNVAKVSNNEQN